MEKPLRSKPLKPLQGAGVGNEDTPSPEQSTPLPPGDKDWSDLGNTRVIQPAEPPSTEVVSTHPTMTLPEDSSQQLAKYFGDFQILQKLGEGAMGAVYKAHQISFNRDVALKILFRHVAGNPKLVERLYREGLTMGQLDHPNIVRGYGVGEESGWHFVAMEFVDGDSLQKWLSIMGRLPLGDALHITLACACALQYAHDQGLVHRDIKPDNILITRKGLVKVADLGMVKQRDEDMALTQTGHAVGTPWYMPLEQARNAKETDGRCDIYALGCMLYCMLTGQPPFAGKTLVEVVQAKEIGTFPPARQVNEEVPERVDLMIAKMAAKLARYRYQNCAELIRDLENLNLASPTLSFLGAGSPPPAGSGRPATRAQATMAGKIDPPSKAPASQPDLWYVRSRNPAGKLGILKMSTSQVLLFIEDKHFDPETTVSRKPDEGFRALATYREFQHHVLARVAKSGADEKTARYRNLYKKIEEQELKRGRAEEKPVTNFGYWMGIFLKSAGVLALIGLLALILYYLGTGLGR